VASANYLRRKLLKPVMSGKDWEILESETMLTIMCNHAQTGDRCTAWIHKASTEEFLSD
jgi:hypothetical protein